MADSDRWIYPDKTSLDFDPQAFSDWSASERAHRRIIQIERARSRSPSNFWIEPRAPDNSPRI